MRTQIRLGVWVRSLVLKWLSQTIFKPYSDHFTPKKYEPHEEVRTFHYLKFLISKSTDDRYSSAAIVFISFEP